MSNTTATKPAAPKRTLLNQVYYHGPNLIKLGDITLRFAGTITLLAAAFSLVRG